MLFCIGTIFFLPELPEEAHSWASSIVLSLWERVFSRESLNACFYPPALLVKRSNLFNFLKVHFKHSLYDSVGMFTGDEQSHSD